MSETSPYDAIGEMFEKVRLSDAPLNARLLMLAEAVDQGAPEFSTVVNALIRRLSDTGLGRRSPAIGETFPSFLLPDQTGRLVALADLLQRGPAVISFLRGHWCPYCRLTSMALARVQEAVGPSHMVAISPERGRISSGFRQETGVDFPVLTDPDCGFALSLNLAFFMDDRFADMLRSIGQDLSEYQAGVAWVLPIPATFVLDSRGTVVARHVDPDYRQRMEIDDLVFAFESAT